MPALARSTDHARMLLNRAQLVLAALAVALAVPVGLVVGLTHQEPAGPASTVLLERPAVVAPAPSATPIASLWAGAAMVREATATVPVVSSPFSATSTRDAGPAAAGLAAGIVTVVICWTLLLVACGIWRSRLAAADARAWAGEWARIEPVWSRRAG
jgi:hypothetical protein